MSDKGRQRTKDLRLIQARRRAFEFTQNSIEDYNFRQLKDLGIIKEYGQSKY